MRFDVEASLTYDFADPCEVLLLVEAALGPDQGVGLEALTFWPNVDAVRVDDPVTFERRTVFSASGRVNALYRAQLELMRRDHAIAEVYLGGRWRLVDATGKAPVDGLVRVASGRDAADIAFMTIFGRATLVEQSFSIRESG